MINRILLCALALALTTTLAAQTYEYSGTSKDGFEPATLEEAVSVVSQVTGRLIRAKSAREFTDVLASHISLPDETAGPFAAFLKEIGNPSAIAYQGGVILVQSDPREEKGSVMRFTSWRVPPNLFVRRVAAETPKDKPKIDPEVLNLLIEILEPDQRVELFNKLKEMGVEPVAVNETSTADVILGSESYLVK